MSETSNYSSESLRNEGGAGLLYAYDSNGVYTHADFSVAGEMYTCPVCACKMHSVTYKSGKKIYARNPGQEHKNRICQTLERKKVKRSFLGLDPDDFISFLCREPVSRIYPPTGSGGPENPQDPQDLPAPPSNEIEVKHTSFSNLQQIAESGIYTLNPTDKQGDYQISDYIITFRYGKNFFANPNFHLGSRILFAKVDWIDYENSSAIFSMFRINDFAVKFHFMFKHEKNFIKFKKTFGRYTEDNMGKTVYERNPHRTYLIASDSWKKLDKSSCRKICSEKYRNCNKCKGMYEASCVTDKQFYHIPFDVK